MSWSIGAVGRPQAVKMAVVTQTDPAKWTCSEPEESIRQAAARLICQALDAQTVLGGAVQVTASGSMSISKYGEDGRTPQEVTNSLTIEVRPLGTFLD